MQAIAREHDSTVPMCILSWLLQEGLVAIPRSSKAERIQQNSFSAYLYSSNSSYSSYKDQDHLADLGSGGEEYKEFREYRGFLTVQNLREILALDGTLTL